MNNYPIIERKGSLDQFIECWSKYYNAYSDEIYFRHIKNDPLTEKDIRELFIWKNGMNLSKKKSISIDTKVIPKLMLINKFRQAKSIDLKMISENFYDLTAIWKIFLLHIINPDRFPIFDQHVYRAMRYIRNNQIEELRNDEKTKLVIYKEEYLSFFNNISAELNDYRLFDKAMWAFGKFLVQGRKIIK